MNRTFNSRLLVTVLSMVLVSNSLFSQLPDAAFDFLKVGVNDASKITKAYISPWANAFGAGSNGSWYNTAKPHKLGGFDITLGFNVGIVPSIDNTYDVSKIGLQNFSGTGMAPTVSGPDNPLPVLTSRPISGVAAMSVETPPGSDWGLIPVPSLQVGIGLPLGSELKVRYIPKITVSDNNISSWGVGLLHSITQYLPGDELLPFDISVFGAYSKLTGNVPISMKPGDPQFYSSMYPSTAWNNQNFKMTTAAWNASAIASFNLPVLTLYGGLGFSKTATTIDLTGNFPLPTPSLSEAGFIYEDAGVVKNFPAIEIENYSGLRANAGLRLKFAVLTWHIDYTWANYSVVSSGLGISFR
jgi:hypothetical protein